MDEIEEENLNLINQIRDKDKAIKALMNRLSISDANLNELKQNYDYLSREHDQVKLFINEIMK